MSVAAAPNRRWLFGPMPDLLLGCGLGYLLLIGTVLFLPLSKSSLVACGLLLSLFVGGPHYGATLLRVYEHRGDRRKYSLLAVYATAAIAIAFVLGLYDFALGSLLITLYLTWSPWHYTGQNYGLALLFLRRRGFVVTPAAKRALHASFILSYSLAFLVLHGDTGGREYLRDGNLMGSVYSFARLGIPNDWRNLLLVVFGGAYLASLILSVVLLARGGRVRELGPTAMLMLVQATWFSAPAIFEAATGRPVDLLSVSLLFIWVAIGHSVQYLWITTYYATKASGGDGGRPERRATYLAKTALAGALIWTLPAIAFAPGLLGTIPYDLGLYLLIAAAVNIHHFVLDGAIWKLKDGRVARILLDQSADALADAPGTDAEPRRRRVRAAVWAVGGACFVLGIVGSWEYQFGYRRALERRDFARAESAASRLIWMGRDHPQFHVLRGNKLLARKDAIGASAAYQRSLDLHPTADGWLGIGLAHERMGDTEAARDAYVAALELDPDNARSLYQLGLILLRGGAADRALPLLERAEALAPDDAGIEEAIVRARRQLASRGAGATRRRADPPRRR